MCTCHWPELEVWCRDRLRVSGSTVCGSTACAERAWRRRRWSQDGVAPQAMGSTIDRPLIRIQDAVTRQDVGSLLQTCAIPVASCRWAVKTCVTVSRCCSHQKYSTKTTVTQLLSRSSAEVASTNRGLCRLLLVSRVLLSISPSLSSKQALKLSSSKVY